MDDMAKVMKKIAILVAPDILQKHVEEHGEIPFTEQVCVLNKPQRLIKT